ncbi:MAG: nitroreductase family protein [Bacteroidales bacterium]|nr:nitroreductase family protein [Bacteroidales bacterium]
MADNYIEKKFDEYNSKKKVVYKSAGRSLDQLLRANRSYRGYDPAYKVSKSVLEKLVAVNTLLPSAKNQQALRFKLVTEETCADIVLDNIKLGGMLPELHLPFAGTEPKAFIIICSTAPESKMLHVDVGIAAQSMLLKAVELGYNGLIIGAFNAKKIEEAFALPYPPVLILAIGKGNEKIELKEISADESHAYYRENGTHIVPKVKWEELIIS